MRQAHDDTRIDRQACGGARSKAPYPSPMARTTDRAVEGSIQGNPGLSHPGFDDRSKRLSICKRILKALLDCRLGTGLRRKEQIRQAQLSSIRVEFWIYSNGYGRH